MPNYANKAQLRVAGKVWEGWMGLEITRSIEQIASTFTFESAARDPGGKNAIRIKPGESCEVLLDGDVVLTGWIDAVDLAHDAASHSIRVSGRSKTRDLVDCSAFWPTGSFKNADVAAIVYSLASQYGVDVGVEGGTEPIPVFTLQDGETVAECIDRLARSRSLLAYDDALGWLRMGPVGTENATSSLILGKNIKSASLKVDVSKRFDKYHVKGQRASDEDAVNAAANAIAAATPTGDAEDDPLKEGRTRFLVLHADGHATPQSCQDRAIWEAATRAGKSVEVVVTVQGWRQEDGTPWTVNTLCHVQDSIIGVDAKMLIVSVTYRLGSDGTTTTITLAPPCGYIPESPKETKGKRKGQGKAGAGISLLSDDDAADVIDEAGE